jgi:hypothetical protein
VKGSGNVLMHDGWGEPAATGKLGCSNKRGLKAERLGSERGLRGARPQPRGCGNGKGKRGAGGQAGGRAGRRAGRRAGGRAGGWVGGWAGRRVDRWAGGRVDGRAGGQAGGPRHLRTELEGVVVERVAQRAELTVLEDKGDLAVGRFEGGRE